MEFLIIGFPDLVPKVKCLCFNRGFGGKKKKNPHLFLAFQVWWVFFGSFKDISACLEFSSPGFGVFEFPLKLWIEVIIPCGNPRGSRDGF